MLLVAALAVVAGMAVSLPAMTGAAEAAKSHHSAKHHHTAKHAHHGTAQTLGCRPHHTHRHRICTVKPKSRWHGDDTDLLLNTATKDAFAAPTPKLKPRYRHHPPKAARHGLPALSHRASILHVTRTALQTVKHHLAATAAARSAGSGRSATSWPRARLLTRSSFAQTVAPQAHTRAATSNHFDGGTTNVDGWHAHPQGTVTRDETRIGDQDFDAHNHATRTFAHKVKVAVDSRRRHHLLVDRCPSANGTVPGDYVNDFDVTISAKSGTANRRSTTKVHVQAKLTGHVNPNSTFRDFDLHLKIFAVQVAGVPGKNGRLYTKQPPRYYVWEEQMNGITIGAIKSGDITITGPTNRPDVHILQATAPHGRIGYRLLGRMHFADSMAKQLYQMANKTRSWIIYSAADDYQQAEAYWQQPGNCMSVKPAAATTTLQPGQQIPVTATITGPPKHGKGLAPGTYTTSATAGTITPTSGAYTPGHPLALTYTAPSTPGQYDVTIAVTSRQGKDEGSIEFTVPTHHYALRWTYTSQIDWDFQDTTAIHDYRNQLTQHFALHASIPLSGDPTAGTVTGSGPAVFDAAAHHAVLSGTFPGFFSAANVCTGTQTTDLTQTNDGTARVLGLHLAGSTGTLDFAPGQQANGAVPARPDERYHHVADLHRTDGQPDPASECAPTSSTLESNYFLHDFADAHVDRDYVFAQPDGTPAHIHLTGGWKPGTGNTVASLTQTITGYELHGTSTATQTFDIVRTP